MSRRVFIAATKQNDGKTTVALGLIINLKKRFKNIGFIKPIGQRYLEEEGLKIDEDSLLIEKTAGAHGIRYGLKDMSPVAVERGFTENYILKQNKNEITRHIKESFNRIKHKQDMMIIEGTGHAGVGSVFDHSNAYVAKLLGSKVVIISSGGIGRPIDEIMLNKALFEREGVKLAGVIINKVLPEKFDKVNKLIRRGLERKGLDVLGVMPYYPELSYPTVRQILYEAQLKPLCGQSFFNNRVSKILIGAMQAKDLDRYLRDQCLLITPGDRHDILGIALAVHKDDLRISGVIITGNFLPDGELIDAFEKKGIPLLFSKDDTYSVVSSMHDLIVKMQPQDKEKINLAVKLVQDYVDIDKLLKAIK
ncbi:MAG: AAA family ATPase [Candidatus Omnitrophica bacterium]|nr:AAA family ATPase [Candidatus Omnitrophota bacterium]